MSRPEEAGVGGMTMATAMTGVTIAGQNGNGNGNDPPDPLHNPGSGSGSGWVQFDEEPAAVLPSDTQNVSLQAASPRQKPPSVNVNINASTNSNSNPNSNPNVNVNVKANPPSPKPPATLTPLTPSRPNFVNGDVVVTLLPVNTKWPWITAAQFRPELVPEELMAQGLTLTVEEYVHAMELLVNDVRFTLYNICYKRVLICWIFLAFVVLMSLLFSGLTGLTLFSFGVVWLLLNAAAIFICMWLKLQLARGLEKCLGRVNKQLIKHKLLVTLDDRGKISCHKVTLCFMYFDTAPCVMQLQQVIDRDEGSSIQPGWERRLDVTANDIIIQGSQTTRLSRRQERAVHLHLRYVSRWARQALRGHINVSALSPGLHCSIYLCPCQFISEHLLCKPPKGILKFCPSNAADHTVC
ncbi:uncharacterized protein LOC143911120 isoform X2 [Arctopsyche grandis]|uniref:uncharacterized protein LOC143911120 isoform X2 n=1 Tax=Arctopsyche grandis TaxID=121162 RepID=UPI00406D6E9B